MIPIKPQLQLKLQLLRFKFFQKPRKCGVTLSGAKVKSHCGYNLKFL